MKFVTKFVTQMQNLDSTKLLIPTNAIDSFDSKSFYLDTRHDSVTNSTQTNLKLKPDCIDKLGLKSVIINKDTEQTFIELSAKVLREQYPLGINSNTIEQALHNISGQAVSFNVPRVLDTAQVLRADFTENVPISSEVALYTASVGGYRYLNSKYRFELYTRRGSESVIVNSRAKSKGYRRRVHCYNKSGELSLAKNRDIAELLPHETFNNRLRVEQNIKGVTDLKATLGISDTSLDSVLNCKATPLLDTFNDITKVLDKIKIGGYQMEEQIYQQFKQSGGQYEARYERFLGQRYRAELAGNDIQLIELELQRSGMSRMQLWRKRADYIGAVTVNRQQEALQQGKTGMIDNEYISELKQGLQQVYSV